MDLDMMRGFFEDGDVADEVLLGVEEDMVFEEVFI